MSDTRMIWIYLLTGLIARMILWVSQHFFKAAEATSSDSEKGVCVLLGVFGFVPSVLAIAACWVIAILGVCGVFR